MRISVLDLSWPVRLFDQAPFDIPPQALCLVYVVPGRYVYLFAPSLRWVPWRPFREPCGSPPSRV